MNIPTEIVLCVLDFLKSMKDILRFSETCTENRSIVVGNSHSLQRKIKTEIVEWHKNPFAVNKLLSKLYLSNYVRYNPFETQTLSVQILPDGKIHGTARLFCVSKKMCLGTRFTRGLWRYEQGVCKKTEIKQSGNDRIAGIKMMDSIVYFFSFGEDGYLLEKRTEILPDGRFRIVSWVNGDSTEEEHEKRDLEFEKFMVEFNK